MSFIKSLKCYFCNTSRSLYEENFPEDLYDLISQYKIDRLLWVCSICKGELDKMTIRKSSSCDSYESYSSNVLESSQDDMDNSRCESQSFSSLRSFSGSSKKNKAGHKYIHESSQDNSGSDSLSFFSLSGSSKENRAECKYIHGVSQDDSGCDSQSLSSLNSLSESCKKNKAACKYIHESSQDDSGCDSQSLSSLNSLSGSSKKNETVRQYFHEVSQDDSGSDSLSFFSLSGSSTENMAEHKYIHEVSQDDSGNDSQALCSSTSLPLPESTKENKAGRKYIHEVLNKIKIIPQEESRNKQIIISVLEMLLTEMKKDEEFSSVFNKLYYTGSAYNDLRITSATEYDIDLILRLPNCINLMPDLFDKTFAFGKIKWEASSNANVPVPVKKFLEKSSIDNYLLPQMVLSWFQRHLDLVLKEINTYPQHVLSVKNCSSGPARTVVIDTTLGYSISIDLVPVFEFDYLLLINTPIFGEIKKTMQDVNRNKWYMVPKACQGEIGDVSLSTSKLSWRLDFPNAEKQILYKKECAKNVIKMLKILRDKRNWTNLASYYLKMVVMLEIIKNPSSDYWNNRFVFERTLDALKELKTYLKNQNLPHFLTNQNLLFKLNSAECTCVSNYLNNIIPKIESDPKTIVKFYF